MIFDRSGKFSFVICMLQIPLVVEFGTDHIEKAICMISAAIFLENVGGIKLKFDEKIDQQPSQSGEIFRS